MLSPSRKPKSNSLPARTIAATEEEAVAVSNVTSQERSKKAIKTKSVVAQKTSIRIPGFTSSTTISDRSSRQSQ
jgi:hypothetical protein